MRARGTSLDVSGHACVKWSWRISYPSPACTRPGCVYLNRSFSTADGWWQPFLPLISTVIREERGERSRGLHPPLLDDRSDSFRVNPDCLNLKPSLLSLLASYRHLRPGADGCLGTSHVAAKRAGIETQIPQGPSRAMGIIPSVVCFSPPPVISPFHLIAGFKGISRHLLSFLRDQGTL